MNASGAGLSRQALRALPTLDSNAMPRTAPTRALLLTATLALLGPPANRAQLAAERSPEPVVLEQSGAVQYRVSPPSGPAPLTVSFEAQGGGDFLWTFGDGSSERGPRVRHTFYRPGEYRVRLEAALPDGRRSTGETRIRAQDAGPEAARMVVLPDTGTAYTFDAQNSLVYAPIERALWDFGDGSRAEGLRVRKDFKPGRYGVKLEVRAGGKRLTQTLSVRAGPLFGEAGFEDRVLALTNDARAKGYDCDAKAFPATPVVRLPALRRNVLLDRAARAQSAAMALADYFDHQSLVDGSRPADRATAAGYEWRVVGENIAAGQPTPEEVATGWLRSLGHCHNIMDASFTEIGLSFVRRAPDAKDSLGRPFWTQVFGRPK